MGRLPLGDRSFLLGREVRAHRVVRYVSRKANPAHELAREGLKSLIKQQVLMPIAAAA